MGLSEVEKIPTVSNQIHQFNTLQMRDITVILKNQEDTKSCAIGPISAVFMLNQISFIVGKNGSGKSTLVKTLAGLYWADSGKIIVNDTPITPNDLVWYRELFSVVFYDFYLFNNLLKYISSEQQACFERVLEKLEIKDAVQIVDQSIFTHALSDGQRKRLALAMSYCYDRPIIIFDECASDQDSQFKHYFYQEILPELKKTGKCVIVISHDKQFFTVADQIINLD